LAQERVVNRIADGGVQQDVHTERDVDVATPRLTASPDALGDQVVVGDIPVEPPAWRPPAGLLAELDRAGARVSVIHAVTGLHGLGATQLAAAYARAKLVAGWRLVAWVSGTDAGSLLAGLAAVADAAGLTDDETGRGVTDAPATVRHWLETDGDRCLLVFDDVSDPEALQAFVPAGGLARVLITSTRRSAANLGSAVPIDVFSAAEASAFLTERTGLDDQAGAAEVASVLGHLPLVLSLAAPLIAVRQVGYWGYLDRLRATQADLSLNGDGEQPYPPSLVRAVLLSLQSVRAADRTGVCARALEILAVLSAAGVRREVLYSAGQAGVLASGRHRVAADLVDRVLDWLSDRSLLTLSLDGQTVTLHRLVAQVIRDEMDRRHMLTAACETAAFVLDVYSRALVGSPDRRAVREIPQLVTALLDSLARPVTEVDEELAWLLLRLRFVAFYHLLELGDSTLQAITVGEPLAEDLQLLLGPDHPDTLNSRNSLAAAYLAAGRVAEAIPLFEQILAVRQRMLGPDDPETLTSQNNLASAYQDAGRVAEAIRLYEPNLEVRERLLGPDHPSTLNSLGNLAAAYLGVGRAAEAIPLLERTLADRERVLGPDHLDTQTSRKNLAKAYQDAGRPADAIPLLERTPPDRKRVLPSDQSSAGNPGQAHPAADRSAPTIPPAERTTPAGLRRPPADPARRVLPAGLRRPPADRAKRPLPSGVARPPAELTDRSAGRTPDRPEEVQYNRQVVEAIAANDPAGIAMAYDRYAAALYGYCHWMLQDSTDAAQALKDTFVIAAATLSDLSEPSELRPRLFALAHNEYRRRIRPGSTAPEETDELRLPSDTAREPSDATVQFRAVGLPSAAARERSEAAREPSDATVQFRAVGQSSSAAREPPDATVQFRLIGLPTDATMPFRVVSIPANARAHINDDQGEAALRTLIYSILAGLKPREREVIELSFRHDLHDNDLAIALGVSSSRTQVFASRARGQLEEALKALHIALTRREACPALRELLADWNGQLTEETRDLVSWHIEECQTCAHHGWGALRPAAFSRLLPLAPLPPEIREQVMDLCTSTTEDAVAYRRRAARRAESIWSARFSQLIRLLSWDSIRAHPGMVVAATAVSVWIVAAVSVTLFVFAGSHAAHAQTVQSAGSHRAAARVAPATAMTSSRSPAAASTTAIAPTSAAARPSPTVTQPSAYVSPPVQSSPSPEVSTSPSPSPSRSKSPSPKPSKSPSPSPSRSASPSPSPSSSSWPSSSPSPTA
jgi:RNA polymerase sigma factor (sigma-70 family)